MNKITFPGFPSRNDFYPGDKTVGSGKFNGFTSFEVLVAMSLIAIVTSLSIPSYLDAIEKRQITNGAETILAFVGTAQSESIKRNRTTTVSYSSNVDGSWCIGVVLGETPCDCTITQADVAGFCAIDSAAWVLRDTDVASGNLISSVSGDGAYAFDPIRGMFIDPADTLLLGLNSGDGKFRMNLSVISTGKMAVCVPALSQDIPGFRPCPT